MSPAFRHSPAGPGSVQQLARVLVRHRRELGPQVRHRFAELIADVRFIIHRDDRHAPFENRFLPTVVSRPACLHVTDDLRRTGRCFRCRDEGGKLGFDDADVARALRELAIYPRDLVDAALVDRTRALVIVSGQGADAVIRGLRQIVRPRDRKSGSAGMPRPISYAVFCLKKKKKK
eukprot:TRINITY_DN27247_c0_g1_i2.p1 TRINITY_DN27247_c0_g1~~TRINITY_DN27247_c0_g1_i2.p1  ORF type:complete len:176 (-),score=26.79 TRINITY_DN27247_c0_g1_i2:5-532(-)